MKNYVGKGDIVTIPNTSGAAVEAGDLYIHLMSEADAALAGVGDFGIQVRSIGGIRGVAVTPAAPGEMLTLQREGVFRLPVDSDVPFGVGVLLGSLFSDLSVLRLIPYLSPGAGDSTMTWGTSLEPHPGGGIREIEVSIVRQQ